MGNAKMWESIAIRFNEVLSEGWEQQFQPQHCNWVMLELREPNKLEAADEPAFGEEFFKCVARIDTLNAQPFGIKHSFFRMQDLGGEINLLIYGGLNISHYNAPWDCLRIEEIARFEGSPTARDRKSTRLNSSHDQISYAVFC